LQHLGSDAPTEDPIPEFNVQLSIPAKEEREEEKIYEVPAFHGSVGQVSKSTPAPVSNGSKPISDRPSTFSSPNRIADNPATQSVAQAKPVSWKATTPPRANPFGSSVLDFAAEKEVGSVHGKEPLIGTPQKKKSVQGTPTGNTCAGCGTSTEGHESVSFSDPSENWHVACISCFMCKRKTGPNFEQKKGILYCPKCSPESSTPANIPQSVNINAVSSPPPARNIPTSPISGKCPSCKNYLRGDTCVAEGREWHVSCFVCCKCRQPLGMSYYDRSDQLYCGTCIAKETGAPYHVSEATECPGCFRRIGEEEHVLALGAAWHAKCFVCTSCKKSFPDGKFLHRDGKPFCKDHIKGYAR